jgi:phage tail-like protein
MVETYLHQALRTFKFQVYFLDEGDTPVLGVNKIGQLTAKTEAIAYRAGGYGKNSAAQIPGGQSFEPVPFEQGLALDDGRFETWALAANNWRDGAGGHRLADFRKHLRIDVLNLSGEIALTYVMNNCWVSELKLPELDANNLNTIAVQALTVVHEGWYRQV